MKRPKNPGNEAGSLDQVWADITRLYNSPGVEATALSLQDQLGANVMVLLFLCWLAEADRRPRAGVTLGDLLASGRWRRVVWLKPVRALRRGLFNQGGGKNPLKFWLLGIELGHERALLEGYLRLSEPLQPRSADDPRLATSYLKHLGLSTSYKGKFKTHEYFKNIREILEANS